MTYDEAVTYLGALINFEQHHRPQEMRTIRLERMRRLCQGLGDPQRRFRSVLVAGTNGKGSICAMIYSMLRESGLRVGLYTSPHLEHVRERIRLWPALGAAAAARAGERSHGDDWIAPEQFAASLERVRARAEDQPTYFEAVTAAAFWAFAQQEIDVAVLEVGLGGRLDATNIVDQGVSVIAPIGIDHADVLGTDLVAIAREKAGIIKPRQTVVSAPQADEVLDVLRVVADAHSVPLMLVGSDVSVTTQHYDLDGLQITIDSARGRYESLRLSLIGRHQAHNAAAAVAAVEALSETGVPYRLVEQGLARVEWPGRLEVVNDSPLVLMDGAHNPAAAQTLAHSLRELLPGRRIHLLMGLSSDKTIEEVGQALGPLAVGVTCTKSHHPRALDPTTLAHRLAPFCADVHVMSDPADAYTYLLNAVDPDEVIVVTGSLFLVGELRAALRQAHVRVRRPAPAAS